MRDDFFTYLTSAVQLNGLESEITNLFDISTMLSYDPSNSSCSICLKLKVSLLGLMARHNQDGLYCKN